MSFKSYASPGKFNPMQVPDQSEKILRNADKMVQGMRAVQKQDLENQNAIRQTVQAGQQRAEQSRQQNFEIGQKNIQNKRDANMANFKVEQANASVKAAQAATMMKQVSELSTTAYKGYAKFTEEREKGLQDAYAMAVYDSGVTTDEAVAITKLDTGLTDSALTTNETVKKLLERGVSLPMIKYMQKVGAGGGGRYLKSKALMQNTVNQAPFAFEKMKDDKFSVNGQAMSYNEAVASGDLDAIQNVQQQMNRKFITSSGLSRMNPEMLGTQAFPDLKSYWKKEQTSVVKKVREVMKAEASLEINRAFETQYRSDGIEGAWGLVGINPDKGTARNDFFKWAQESAESGQTNLTFAGIANKKVTINGKTRSMQEWYGRTDEFQDMKKAFEEKRKMDRYQRTENLLEQESQFKNAQQEVVQYLGSQDNLTQEQVDAAKMELKDKFPGMDPTALDKIVISDDRMLASQRAEVAAAAKDGSLTLAELSTYDYRVFREFQDVARRYSDAEGTTNKFKIQKDAIKDMVKLPAFVKFSKDGSAGPTVRLKTAQLQRDFSKRVAQRLVENPGADPNEVGNQVLREITDEFNTKYNDDTNKGETFKRRQKEGYFDVWEGTVSADEVKGEVNKTLDSIDRAVLKDANQALKTPNLILDEAAAEVLTSTYGQPEWKPGAAVSYTADRLNITPLQVINSQLEALNEQGADYELLKPTPSQEAIQKNVRPEIRKILEHYNTPDRSTRGLGSSGTFMKDVVPHSYGDYVEQSAQSNGVPPWDVAALIETESSWNVNAVSPTGAAGLMQIQEKWHPEYTYSNDPQEQIAYGTQYYGQMVQQFGDPVTAAGAYNVGPNAMQDHLDNGTPLPQETVDHMRKFAKAQYKYGKRDVLTQARTMRPAAGRYTMMSTAANYIGMDTSAGPDGGNQACVWALNKVMRSSGVNIPWGDSVYVPEVKNILDKKGTRVNGPQPGAIAIMQDNGNPPYPHIGIVGPDGLIISNSSARAKFDWQGTPAEYEQKYGKPNLYYMI